MGIFMSQEAAWCRGIDLPQVFLTVEEQTAQAQAIIDSLDATNAPAEARGLLARIFPDQREAAIAKAATQLGELLFWYGILAWDRGGPTRIGPRRPGPIASCVTRLLALILQPVAENCGTEPVRFSSPEREARAEVFRRVSAYA